MIPWYSKPVHIMSYIWFILSGLEGGDSKDKKKKVDEKIPTLDALAITEVGSPGLCYSNCNHIPYFLWISSQFNLGGAIIGGGQN